MNRNTLRLPGSVFLLHLLLSCASAALAQSSIKQVVLGIHNSEREELGLEPLQWSDALSESAAQWASTLAVLDKASHSDSGYGENIWFGSYQSREPEEMVKAWLDEKQYFLEHKPVPHNCRDSWQQCGHYSQMVWSGTTHIGCGTASNQDNTYFVCQYDPPGNVQDRVPY